MKFHKSSAAFLSAMLLVGSSAFAMMSANGSHKGSGAGSYKTCDGKTGEYTVDVEMSFDEEKGEANFKEHYTSGDQTKDIEWRLVKGEHGFFKVYSGDDEIGKGYCFDKEKGKVCHMGAKCGEGWSERTVCINTEKKQVKRMGSFHGKGKTVAYKDKIKCADEE